MNENQSIGRFLSKRIESLREIAGTLGVIGGICYVIGYIAVNIYLSQFGVNYLNLIQARYFATGLLYIVFLGLVFIGPVLSIIAFRQTKSIKTSSTRNLQSVALVIANIALISILIWAIGLLVTEVDRFDPFAHPISARQVTLWIALPISHLALIFPIIVMWLVERYLAIRAIKISEDKTPGSTQEYRLIFRAIFSGLFVICLLISLYVFAVSVYPNVSPSFGGGAPILVQVLVREESKLSTLDISVIDGLTEPLILIDQTSEKLLLHNGIDQIIELQTRDIVAIVRND